GVNLAVSGSRAPRQNGIDLLGGRHVEVGWQRLGDLHAGDLELLDQVVGAPANRITSAHPAQPATGNRPASETPWAMMGAWTSCGTPRRPPDRSTRASRCRARSR